ncbi:MAG TPA: D-2-hydroxyacid dehydrogenase family protein [Acidimicrobiales bacterium]|nr:D-2-hydroxyacid dehydrogenase family protein [Acidimicrobiales bacterium]
MGTNFRVAVLDDYQHVAEATGPWHLLPDGVEVEYFQDHLSDERALAERLSPFQAVVAMRERTPFPASLLNQLTNLRLLVTTGPFNAVIDLAAATSRGVVVCGTGGQRVPGSDPTAELTWGLILATARHIPLEDRGVRAGRWQQTVGTYLYGKTVALLGLGHIGSAVAGVGRAFGMKTIAWSPNLTEERARQGGAALVSKADLFRTADVLSVHLVLSDRTMGIVGEHELSLMKPTASLINTSRGPLVSEAALVAALRAGRIAGAGLDVFDPEPLPPDHPLCSMDNVVLTPHLGYVTEGTYASFFTQIVEDVRAYLEGTPIRVIAG